MNELRSLVIVLGDQLDLEAAAFDDFDTMRDSVWMAEAAEESTHVRSSRPRIALFLAAMRHFAQALREAGRTLHYIALDAPLNCGSLAAQFDGKWNDDLFLEGTNSEVSFERSYSVWNASLSYASEEGGFGMSVYARNLFDEEYRVYDLDLGLLGFIEQAFGPPRQLGMTVSYRF